MNQNVKFFFEIFVLNFRGRAIIKLCQFEPQDNEISKVIKFKPFSIYPENFKSIFLIVIENLRAQKGPKKSENGV